MGVNAAFVAVDLSHASLGIARDRARRIGLANVHFECRRLEQMNPADDGLFDYIDCCGVLHHLDDPQAGLRALVDCLTPGGGIGLMLYGVYGRTGVYEAQRIIGLLDHDASLDKGHVDRARRIIAHLPRRNRLKTNPMFENIERFTDEEFADTFLHPKDRAYRVLEIRDLLAAVGMEAVSFLPSFQYDPSLMLPAGETRDSAGALSWWTQRELAELLSGTMRKHALYAKRASALPFAKPEIVPALVPAPVQPMLSRIVDQRNPEKSLVRVSLSADGLDSFVSFKMSEDQASMLKAVDGRMSLDEIRQRTVPNLSWDAFRQEFDRVRKPLTAMGVLFLSSSRFV